MAVSKRYLEGLFRKFYENRSPLYIHRPIPCEFDMEISGLVHAFMQAPLAEREQVISHMHEDYSDWLFAFSVRMAALAVREDSRQHLLEGLVALVLEDYRYDYRDNVVCLGPIYHSAVKIGIDPIKLFAEAASFANNRASDVIANFPSRPPEKRGLKAMGYKESSGPDGFRYEQT